MKCSCRSTATINCKSIIRAREISSVDEVDSCVLSLFIKSNCFLPFCQYSVRKYCVFYRMMWMIFALNSRNKLGKLGNSIIVEKFIWLTDKWSG